MTTPRELYHPLLWAKLHEKNPEAYPAPTTDEQRYIDAHEIRTRYALLMSDIAKPYTQTERETWFTQLKEADEWLADNNTPAPMLTAIAAARGISVAALVAKVKENDGLFRQAIGALLGQQQHELDLL
jgi:hypothetical protein